MGSNASKSPRPQSTTQPRKPKVAEKSLKLILLGTGDSGKTTVFKQLIHYSENEIDEGAAALVSCARDLGKNLSELHSHVIVLETAAMDEEGRDLDEKLVASILALWESEQIQSSLRKCYESGKYIISDNYKVLMEKLKNYPAFGGSDWKPTIGECLLGRNPTIGVRQQDFISGSSRFRIYDVGGQRSERNKWLTLFQDLTGVIYVSSMSDYDQTLFEDTKENRLVESITTFKKTAEAHIFANTLFILFLNKSDLFSQKYSEEKIPLNISGYFPNAPLVEDDPDESKAKEWFKDLLLSNLEGHAREREYFSHITNALDFEKMGNVIHACTVHIVKKIVNSTMGV